MKRNTVWLAMFALLTFTVSAFAQVGRIEGDIVKRGSTEGIPGAEVVIERTDIKGSYPVKSDKKGHYLHAGVPYVGTYTIMVSAPGFAPNFVGGVKPGGVPPEGIKIELDPGDGSKMTLDMIKRGGGGTAPAPGAKQPTAAEGLIDAAQSMTAFFSGGKPTMENHGDTPMKSTPLVGELPEFKFTKKYGRTQTINLKMSTIAQSTLLAYLRVTVEKQAEAQATCGIVLRWQRKAGAGKTVHTGRIFERAAAKCLEDAASGPERIDARF